MDDFFVFSYSLFAASQFDESSKSADRSCLSDSYITSEKKNLDQISIDDRNKTLLLDKFEAYSVLHTHSRLRPSLIKFQAPETKPTQG